MVIANFKTIRQARVTVAGLERFAIHWANQHLQDANTQQNNCARDLVTTCPGSCHQPGPQQINLKRQARPNTGPKQCRRVPRVSLGTSNPAKKLLPSRPMSRTVLFIKKERSSTTAI
ncbi:hypothetical protein PoB_005511000 [Plakobranchus ocellatus]|uniref:Uncharacterized protein n=1 Tax=Plakobranchus ocellatus TaxID=259542 RepID=A0AAV4CB09_9GAST|nr:hypothetical protein PoB_005511000 [Plakobranchus ocellatus]